MSEREPSTAGGVFACENEAGMAAILAAAFPQTRVGESCHYSTGKYVRIDFESGVEFFFERISDEEYLIRGEGDDPQSLGDAAAEIAKHLGLHGLRCRFETYGPDDARVAYADHEWPLPVNHDG